VSGDTLSMLAESTAVAAAAQPAALPHAPTHDIWVVIGAVGTSFAAVCALGAAIASFRAIRQARLASQATLLSELLSEYAQPKMKNALRVLGAHRDAYPDDFVAKQQLHSESQWPAGAIVDEARRYVSHFFFRVYRLREGGYIDSKFMNQIASLDGVALLLKVCEPLARAINPGDPGAFFDSYRALWADRADEHLVRPAPRLMSETRRIAGAVEIIRLLRLIEPKVRGLHSQLELKRYAMFPKGVLDLADEIERRSNFDRFESALARMNDHNLEVDVRKALDLQTEFFRLRRQVHPDRPLEPGTNPPYNGEIVAVISGLDAKSRSIQAVTKRLQQFAGVWTAPTRRP
jgi:hypothetical protein